MKSESYDLMVIIVILFIFVLFQTTLQSNTTKIRVVFNFKQIPYRFEASDYVFEYLLSDTYLKQNKTITCKYGMHFNMKINKSLNHNWSRLSWYRSSLYKTLDFRGKKKRLGKYLSEGNDRVIVKNFVYENQF